MLDKKTGKVYRKLVSASSQYEAFTIIDRLDPHTAKRVLLTLVMNSNKYSKEQFDIWNHIGSMFYKSILLKRRGQNEL